MKILVTGGSGFIGHHVVAQLERLGHECFILDNWTDYGLVPKDEMQALHAERQAMYRAPLHKITLGESSSNAGWMCYRYQPDVVIHMASFPRQKVVSANPRWGSDVMIGGTIDLLEASRATNVKHFVFISSSMVYGDFTQDIDESGPCNPIGQYGILKLTGEQLVKDYARRSDFTYTIVRPSAVYGPRDIEDRVVSKFLTAAIRGDTLKVKGANECLDFTHVNDVTAGIVASAIDERAAGQTFNITRSRARTLLEAAELAIAIAGKGTVELQDKDAEYPSRARLKIDRARELLGYIPTIDIEQGFQDYYQWLTK